MSTGSYLPYHLRTNKAVERFLLLELLVRLDKHISLAKHKYIGVGGPFLEDFKLMHAYFPEIGMVSLEYNRNVVRRQLFNKPNARIQITYESTTEYIAKYSEGQIILWLDFLGTNILDQIHEFQAILNKVERNSIIKITLNASPSSLGKPKENPDNQKDLQQYRYDKLRNELTELFPASATPDDIITRKYPAFLLRVIRNAVFQVKHNADYKVQPLTAYSYHDGQPMLTFTCLVSDDETIKKVRLEKSIKDWKFTNLFWRKPHVIDMPDLSVRERMYLEQQLPCCGKAKLPFRIDDSISESNEKLKQYSELYLYYPMFSKIVI